MVARQSSNERKRFFVLSERVCERERVEHRRKRREAINVAKSNETKKRSDD